MTSMTSQGTATMERLRTDLLRRARSERETEAHRIADSSATPSDRDLESNQPQPTQTPTGLLNLPNLLGRRRGPQRMNDGDEIETPKSPDFSSRTSQPRRFKFPSLGQMISRGQNQSSPTELPHPTRPAPSQPREPGRTNTTRLDTPDPANVHLAQLAEDGRRRRNRQDQGSQDQGTSRNKPKRFLGCLPWVPSRRIRSLILRCLVSGLFFGILLAVYLGLAASNTLNTGEQTIMLMLIILLATAFFCYSLLRLCLLVVRGGRPVPDAGSRSAQAGRSGYAIPSQPIRVVLARDEEAVGTESESHKTTPPAYGLWRESVRVDPNRLFWQRNDPANIIPSLPEGIVGSRPPSYASEDGVSYVIEAAPRSTVPATVETAMPIHPSEVGRAAQRPT